MFEDLIFANDFEKETFKKYLPLKGKFLHKQIYDILKEANGGQVTYYELSSVLRYDKNLRDTLYIYLATAEEYLKALLLDKFDSDKKLPKYIFGKFKVDNFKNNLYEINQAENSKIYYKLNIDFEVLLNVCIEKNLIEIDQTSVSKLNTLRNHTMHHAMLLFGQAHNLKEAKDNFRALERQLTALLFLLPEDYRAGFKTSINRLNGTPERRYLTKFYLETENGLHIKE